MASESNMPIGVLTTGCIVGLVVAYTNFVGFLAGVVTGIYSDKRTIPGQWIHAIRDQYGIAHLPLL